MAENLQSIIEEYVQKCNAVIETGDNNQARLLWNDLRIMFKNLIPGYMEQLRGNLDEDDCEYNGIPYDADACYLNDMNILVVKLRKYSAQLEHEQTIARYSQPITNVSQNINIDINAIFSQAYSYVLESKSFSPEETKEIRARIDELKTLALSSENKPNKWEKIKPILEWTIARGIEIALVIIPLIVAALK